METAPLKSFATSARLELIGEVQARILAVLAEGSYERREHPQAIAHLGRALEAEGAGEKGRQAVADRVAYIWFNRIVALRFMDALGYTGVGVVSPPASQAFGQPEILANAKGGLIDSQAVSEAVARTVHALLDGQRPSQDPQGEAYALLLKEYCQHWHQALPFMFGRHTSYTELLVPSNLLADDSILARAREVLTHEVSQDVEAIGWLYQFYISERKDEVFAGFKKNQKAGAAEIPAATQLFTPHWIVRYLVENSVGRLWMLNHPGSQLVEQMDYYIAPVEEESDFLKISSPEELKIIDPACGSGHMLTYAFDLLYAIYEEEGYAPSEIPSLILTHNLYGTEIDPRAGALAAFALTMKALAKQRRFLRKGVQPNICLLKPVHFSSEELSFLMTSEASQHKEIGFWTQFEHADVLGSLIQPDAELLVGLRNHLETLSSKGDVLYENILERAHQVITQAEYLTQRYNVAVANPPYMGSKNMGAKLSEVAKENYPNSKSDLFAMFIDRVTAMVESKGFIAQVTMQSWMFLPSYESLRAKLQTSASITSMLHMGNTVMRIAFGTSATVWQIAGNPNRRSSPV